MPGTPPRADSWRLCCHGGRGWLCSQTRLSETGMWPPIRRSQSECSSSSFLGMAGMLWKQQKELRGNPRKGAVCSWVQVCSRDLQGKSFRSICYQPHVTENDGYTIVFLCYRIFSTFTLPSKPCSQMTCRSRAVVGCCRMLLTCCISGAGA